MSLSSSHPDALPVLSCDAQALVSPPASFGPPFSPVFFNCLIVAFSQSSSAADGSSAGDTMAVWSSGPVCRPRAPGAGRNQAKSIRSPRHQRTRPCVHDVRLPILSEAHGVLWMCAFRAMPRIVWTNMSQTFFILTIACKHPNCFTHRNCFT
eukprot:352648-Chlamydomonas_euryale.AAC.6